MTPAGAFEIMEVIGKEESLSRIRKGIELSIVSVPDEFYLKHISFPELLPCCLYGLNEY